MDLYCWYKKIKKNDIKKEILEKLEKKINE